MTAGFVVLRVKLPALFRHPQEAMSQCVIYGETLAI